MRKIIALILSFGIFLTISCKKKTSEKLNEKRNNKFELLVSDYNYSLAYSVVYKITNENLTITFSGELENEKDSIIYSTNKIPKDKIGKISELNIENLNENYSNGCIDDGDIKTFQINKNGKTKFVSLQNYYHPELSPVIETINGIIPKKYKMHLDKDKLIEEMKNCEGN